MRSTFIAAALAIAFVAPAAADHCTTWSTTTQGHFGSPVVEAAGHYAFIDCAISAVNGCEWFNVWVYEESNGMPGLQRWDDGADDTCHGMIAGDTVVL